MIDAFTVRQLEDARSYVLLPVVDDVLCAAATRDVGLGWGADSCDGAGGAGPAGELQGVVADGTGTTRDQHALVPDLSVRKEAAVGGHRRNAERCALGEAGVLRELVDQVLGEADEIGGVAEAAAGARTVVDPHALAEPGGIGAGADLVDHARAVAVGDEARKLHRASAAPHAQTDVGGIDARSAHLDPHLALTGARRRHLTELENVARRALSLVPECSHGA